MVEKALFLAFLERIEEKLTETTKLVLTDLPRDKVKSGMVFSYKSADCLEPLKEVEKEINTLKNLINDE